jgi:hypothetical protein
MLSGPAYEKGEVAIKSLAKKQPLYCQPSGEGLAGSGIGSRATMARRERDESPFDGGSMVVMIRLKNEKAP